MQNRLAVVITAVLLIGTASAGAFTIGLIGKGPPPKHEWTIKIGTYCFGLVEWPSSAVFHPVLGKASQDKPVVVYFGRTQIAFGSKVVPLLTGAGALLIIGLASTLMLRKHAFSNRQSV